MTERSKPDGAGSPDGGSPGVGSPNVGSTGAGSTGAGSPDAGPAGVGVSGVRGKSGGGGKKRKPGDAAFDVWLERGLHQLYDDVAREPVPDELLRLIRDDEAKP